MLRLSAFSEAIAAVGRGRDIALKAYTLSDRLIREIELRAEAGAHVSVTMEANPSGSHPDQLQRHNEHVAAKLRSCGVDAVLQPNVHTKTIAVDGTVFFDESNWREGDLILSAAAADAGNVASLKSSALNDESDMLDCARSEGTTSAIVETETFDRFNVVSKALREMAERGMSPRLLVDGRALRDNKKEAVSLAWIQRQGVDVRVCNDTEKFALAGNHAWLGSANVTSAYGGHDMTDWGVVTEDPAIVAAVRDRLETRWANAHELRPLAVV